MTSSASLSIYQGDDYAAIVRVTDADTLQPADLTGYIAEAQIRTDVADKAPTIVDTFDVVVDGSDVYLRLSHDQTASLAGSYKWDLQMTDSDGVIQTVLFGKVVVQQEVTRP
jgi:hypothetical protein